MVSIDALRHELAGPGVEVRETHISLVFLGDGVVHKIKKPVDLGFLDFRELATRKHLCEREVELNRRLAPDVYLRVVPVTRSATGALRFGGDAEPLEWAVEMRRLPDSHSAEAKLDEGTLTVEHMRKLANHLASFHRSARTDEELAGYGAPELIGHNVRENFAQTQTSALRYVSRDELARARTFQADFVDGQRTRLEARVEQGRIRDGHGDLRLEHCYLAPDGSIAIIDCIEFNERFRYADVAADIAFLSMDLLWHDRHDLSEALLSAYARASGDFDLYGVIDFYESYRAYVRAKVSSLLADDTGASTEARKRAASQARKYYMLAAACAAQPLVPPTLYAVAGVIASGKSTVADRLATLAHGPVLDADRIRKQQANVDETTALSDAPFQGHYTPADTEHVYAELLRRAEIVLRSGRPAVLDASFRSRAHRSAVRELAARCGARFRLIECRIDRAVVRERLQARARAKHVSDGRLEILDAFIASFEPIDELPDEERVTVDTSQPIERTVEELARRVL